MNPNGHPIHSRLVPCLSLTFRHVWSVPPLRLRTFLYETFGLPLTVVLTHNHNASVLDALYRSTLAEGTLDLHQKQF